MKSTSKKKAGQQDLTDTQTPGIQDKESRFIQGGSTKANPAGQKQDFNRTQSEELEDGQPIQGKYRHGRNGQPPLEDGDPQGSGLNIGNTHAKDKDNLSLGKSSREEDDDDEQ
jgi:hypothetical protein